MTSGSTPIGLHILTPGIRADARHSRNIARTGQVFVVIFDSMGAGGGLYICAMARQLAANELKQGLAAFNAKRQKLSRETVPPSYFTGAESQRLYMAAPTQFWVNMAQKDATGHIVYDKRYPSLQKTWRPTRPVKIYNDNYHIIIRVL